MTTLRFDSDNKKCIPVLFITEEEFEEWSQGLSERSRQWVCANHFSARAGQVCVTPDEAGNILEAFIGIRDHDDFWNAAHAASRLPVGDYRLNETLSKQRLTNAAVAWDLAAYRFTRYKSNEELQPSLVLSDAVDKDAVLSMLAAIKLTRDLINTPTEDMGPAELAKSAQDLAALFDAQCEVIFGDQLLQENYPAIHTVGRASVHAPRLVDLTWGNASAPKLTLVGKGVCFDTGGLDIKPAAGMNLMKKDMGGAAHVLGLAYLIMSNRLAVRLRVLIPAVENSISGNAYRPGDVISTRKGLTVEIGNTDAEGRLVLADALTEAASENPDRIIDFATLTGAARIALGTELPALFCNDASMSSQLIQHAALTQDPLWQMPLHLPYRKLIDSKISDLSNSGSSPYAGAITAALFLNEFVGNIPWAHFDVMAWNVSSQVGRPEGGEAMGLRAVYSYLEALYS